MKIDPATIWESVATFEKLYPTASQAMRPGALDRLKFQRWRECISYLSRTRDQFNEMDIAKLFELTLADVPIEGDQS